MDNFVFAGVAAILAIQPSVYRTWKLLFDQIISNTMGAAISLFFLYYFGENPFVIGIVIILMISLSIKLKMEKNIPLTLVTVIAIMGAEGSADLYFAIERFLVILIGTITAILVNILIYPPKYKNKYIQDVETTFQKMSVLMRTAISNELTEASYKEVNKKFKKDLLKLEEKFKLFDEEREKLGKSNELNTREIILFKQMLKVLQEGSQLLENIEEHYQGKVDDEDKIFDQQLEELIKYHEYLLFKYSGKIKGNHRITEGNILLEKDKFYDKVLEFYLVNKEKRLRNMIIASSIVDYSFHLERLEKMINNFHKIRDTKKE
jgi:uncharacterized membrane protein YgaE (UPF0421/DUF939 family)